MKVAVTTGKCPNTDLGLENTMYKQYLFGLTDAPRISIIIHANTDAEAERLFVTRFGRSALDCGPEECKVEYVKS